MAKRPKKRTRTERAAAPVQTANAPVARAPGAAAESRRRFLLKAWLGLAAVALAEAAWVVVEFLRPRRVQTFEESTIVVAGPVDRFEAGSVTAFPQGRFYLVRLEDGGFLALSRVCTHLGCTVPWIADEHRFLCPCHASAFDVRGDVVNPPAPRALDLYPVRIENHIVKVDVATPIPRSAFEAAQVTRT
jgi:cytochrome b6-f complex iron-sulfur subunit